MEIYNYNSAGVFTRKTTAKIDPLETKKNGNPEEAVYLLPRFATFKTPPTAGPNEVPVFNEAEDRWEIKPNILGKTFFDKNTGASVIISSFDENMSNLTDQKPQEHQKWDYNKESWVLDNTAILKSIREERNKRLADSDWTQLIDSPLTEEQKSAWANYRQALRDMLQNYVDPAEIQWPEKPE